MVCIAVGTVSEIDESLQKRNMNIKFNILKEIKENV